MVHHQVLSMCDLMMTLNDLPLFVESADGLISLGWWSILRSDFGRLFVVTSIG